VNWPLAHLGLHTGVTLYAGLLALGVNLTVTVVGTLVCHWFGVREGEDATSDADYLADEGDPTIRRMAELIDGPQRYEPRHARCGLPSAIAPRRDILGGHVRHAPGAAARE